MTITPEDELQAWGDQAQAYLAEHPEVSERMTGWILAKLDGRRNSLDWPGWAGTPPGPPPYDSAGRSLDERPGDDGVVASNVGDLTGRLRKANEQLDEIRQAWDIADQAKAEGGGGVTVGKRFWDQLAGAVYRARPIR